MKYMIAIVGLCFSLNLRANVEFIEEGWKGKLRPLLVKIVGEDTTNSLIGNPPEPPKPVMELPPIPKLERKNTDVSVYDKTSALNQQGKEYDSLPVEKRQSFDVAYVQEIFKATRRTSPKDEDLSKWMNVLEGGGSREGVYRGLVLDEVYVMLEGYEDPSSPKLREWVGNYTKKFLALSYKPETLEKINLYMIKRIVAEKSLEVLEALEVKPDDFYKWYAVLSADLAQQFPNVWLGNKLRANPEAEVHLSWVKKVPLQHIKSELVIKLHTVMNDLQDKK